MDFRSKMISLGLCHKWQRLWHSQYSQLDIVNMGLSMEGIEFQIKHRKDISAEDVLNIAGGYLNNGYIVYPDEPHLGVSGIYGSSGVEISRNKADVLFIKDSVVKISLSKWQVLRLIVVGDSKVYLTCENNNIVITDLYDNSKCIYMQEGNVEGCSITTTYKDKEATSFVYMDTNKNKINIREYELLDKEVE